MIGLGTLGLLWQASSLTSWSLESSRGKDAEQTFLYSFLQFMDSRNVFPLKNVETEAQRRELYCLI